MFQAAVDGLCGSVGCAGAVEVGQDVDGAAFQCPAESDQLGQGGRDVSADSVDDLLELDLACLSVTISVGGDDALVDAPGRLDFDVAFVGKHRLQPLPLAVGEQIGAGAQHPADAVERVTVPSFIPAYDFTLSELLKTLSRLTNELVNVGSGSAPEALEQYQRWSTSAADTLGYQFANDDLERLILTRRHWLLQEMVVTGNGPSVHDLVRADKMVVDRALKSLVQDFQSVEREWKDVTAKIVIADTNVYEHNEQYWNDIDWPKVVGAHETRLLIPSVVLRELDKHKRSDRNNKVSDTNPEPVRTRARVSSRRIRETFAKPDWVTELQPSNHGYAELLLDSIDHVPLDDPDSEIIDRALDLQRLLSRPVSILTGDGNMQFQAQVAGLEIVPVYESGH